MERGDSRRRRRANGEGGIHEDKARGRWVGSITVGYDGKRQVRRSVTGRTKREVVDKLNALRQAADAGLAPARAELTVTRFLETWLTDVLPGTVAPLTQWNYEQVARRYVIPTIGQKRLRTLTARDVAVMLRQLEQGDPKAKPPRRPVAPNTRRAARSVLRRALRWAEAEGMVARNVAQIAPGVRIGGTEGRTLTIDDARRLLAAVEGHRLEAAFSVALALGLRRGELLGLAWDDLELDREPSRLAVRRALKRVPGQGLVLDEPKTKTSRRTVHLPRPVVAALRAHRVRQAAERLQAGPEWVAAPLGVDLVFRTPFGTPVDPDNFRHACYRLTEDAGLGRWSPHELRHSAASILIAQGVDLKLISELLGHSSIRVTSDVYGHLLDAGKAHAAAAMDAALWGPGG